VQFHALSLALGSDGWSAALTGCFNQFLIGQGAGLAPSRPGQRIREKMCVPPVIEPQ
jgi:hypothetical protein